MSQIFACHFRVDNQTGFARLVGGPVRFNGVLKGHLYAWTVQLGFVAVRRFGECVRRTGPCARNPGCYARIVIDE